MKTFLFLLISANIAYWGFSSWHFSGDIAGGVIIGILTSVLCVVIGVFIGLMVKGIPK